MIFTSCTQVNDLEELIANSDEEVVFFDVGHVLAKINFRSQNERTIKQLGCDYFDYTEFLQRHQKEYFMGELTTQRFDTLCQKHLLTDLKISELRKGFYTEHVQINKELLSTIKRLTKTKTVSCLSNIFPVSRDVLAAHDVFKLMKSPVFSCDVGLLKPDEEIYLHACKTLQQQPEYCLFVDDKLENLVSAKRVGMRCLHYRFG